MRSEEEVSQRREVQFEKLDSQKREDSHEVVVLVVDLVNLLHDHLQQLSANAGCVLLDELADLGIAILGLDEELIVSEQRPNGRFLPRGKVLHHAFDWVPHLGIGHAIKPKQH